jgi:hypothetical protein
MSKRHILTPGIWTLLLLVFAMATQGAQAQDTSTPSATSTQDSNSQSQEPVPAYGQENAPPPVTENPPLSGIDMPNLEPHAAPLSYIQPGATVSESADTNVANTLGGGQVASVTRGLGSVALQRLWSHYVLALDYIGGVGYYDVPGEGFKALQQMDLNQKLSWKRGELNLRDSFSYLPEGNFGGAYGSLGSQGIASLGNTGAAPLLSGSVLGTLGLVPRVLNVSMADVSEYLSPNSALTAAGGYAFTHFYGSTASTGTQLTGISPATGTQFIGSSEVFAQAGYSRVLTAHTQVALMYAYQAFDFNFSGLDFHSHIIQAMYGHRVSGRMDFLVAAGPQFTVLGLPCTTVDVLLGLSSCSINQSGQPVGTISDTRIGVAGRARLRYRFPKTSLEASYDRYETSGSGLFAGAQTDLARLGADRPLSRVWSVSADLGYSRNVRLQPASTGVNANSYQYGFAGVAVHRMFGHNFNGFASYQFNGLDFDSSFCAGVTGACNRISNRQIVTIGLDWTPRPIRLD